MTKIYLKTPEAVIKALKEGKEVFLLFQNNVSKFQQAHD